MKEMLQQYAVYTIWANNRIFDRLLQLKEEEVNKEIASSFPSVFKTCVHMLDAVSIWWLRHKMVENITYQGDSFNGSFAELIKAIKQKDADWKEWIDGASEMQVQHVFAYIRNKEQNKIAVNDLLLHLFNHATYHRGQLVTLLRQLGAEKIPATDYSQYCRERK